MNPTHRFQRILVAVDRSLQSQWALDVGMQLARELGAKLAAVHVIDTQLAYSVGLAGETGLPADLRPAAEMVLSEATSRVAAVMHIETFLREGIPGGEIAAAAREWGASLLIIGAHGRGRLATFLLGSVTEQTIKLAPCPVMAVAHEPGKIQ